jgi:hypothetical protein
MGPVDDLGWRFSSRTPISSPTSASTSSSRSSESSLPRLEEHHGIRSSPKSESSRSTSPRVVGPGAMGNCCRCRRTRRCSRSWARPTAATARATSRCRTCRAERRCTRGRGRGSRSTTSGETGGAETVSLLESEIPRMPTLPRLEQRLGDLQVPSTAGRFAPLGQAANAYRCAHRSSVGRTRRSRPPAAISRTTTCSRT